MPYQPYLQAIANTAAVDVLRELSVFAPPADDPETSDNIPCNVDTILSGALLHASS